MSYKRIIKKVGRSVLYLFISVAILVCLFLLFINLPVGRRVVKNQVQSYLEEKFKSKVVIGSIDYSLPKWIEVNDVYIEDKNKDTLLYGEKIYVNVDMYRLAFGYTNIREVAFNNIVIHVNRREQDTSFNYQFVMDAFAGNKPATQVDMDTVEMKLTLSRLLFNKVLLKYRDKKEGVDFDAYIKDLDASLNSFRPERTIFAIQHFRASEVDFAMTMYKDNRRDTLVTEPGTLDSLPGNGLHITAQKLNLRNVHVSVQDKVTGMYYSNKVRHLGLTNALFDLPRSIGTADSLLLDSSFVQFTNPVARPRTGPVDTTLAPTPPWYISVKQVSLSENQLKFDDNNAPRAGGFDPSHFDVKGLRTDIANFLLSKDRTQANVKQFAFSDTSGFRLDTTHVNFLMTDSIISATDLYVKTPGSLLREYLEIKFDSLAGIKKNPRNSLLSALLHNSTIAFNDLYLLFPALKKSFPPEQFANTKVFFNTEIRGNLAQVYLPSLQLLFGGSSLRAHGYLYNLTDADRFYYDLYIEQGIFRKSDLLKFIPKENQASFAQLPDVINLRGRLKGNRDKLESDVVATGKGMLINGKFTITNLADPKRLSFDLVVKDGAFSKDFILGFIPPGTLPPEINLPAQNYVRGYLKGNVNDLVADLKLNGSYGPMTIRGFIKNLQTPEISTYDLFITTNNFDIGKLISQDSVLGKVTGSFKLKGRGFNYKTMRSDIMASIKQLQYKNYNYQNAEVKANFNNGLIDTEGSIDDPNLKLQWDLTADVRTQYPAFNGFVNVDTARLQALNLYKDTLNFSMYAKVGANSLTPRNLDIHTIIDSVRLQMGRDFYLLDSISLIATSSGGVDDINFYAPFANIRANGAFDYDRIDEAVVQYINHYYRIAAAPEAPVRDQQVTFSGQVKYHPIVPAVLPILQNYADVDFNGSFVSANRDSALNLVVTAPLVTFDNYTVRNGRINVQSRNERLNYAVDFDTLRFANNIFYGTTLNGSAANDSLLVNALTQDDRKQDWFGLKASAHSKNGVYTFRLIDSLLLNYERWNVASDNYIQYSKQGWIVHNFRITSDTASIFVNSRQQLVNSPIDAVIDNFNLRSISSILNKDTVLISGIMDAKLEVNDLYKKIPAFTGTMSITDLAIRQQPVGNVNLWASKQSENNVAATLTITGNGNDISAKGNYYLNNELNQFDAEADIRRLNVATVQGFTFGSITNASGSMHGNASLNGRFSDPRWKGALYFDTTKFTIAQLGSVLRIDNQKITFEHPSITLDNFLVRDSANNEMRLNGAVSLNKTGSFDLNLDVKASDFIVMNAPRAINTEIYGYAAADMDIRITGNSVRPNIEGNIAVKDRSNVTIVIPERSYNKDAAKTIVRFIDRDTFDVNPPAIPFVEEREAGSNFAQFLNYNLNVEITKGATLTIIVDPVTGDEIKVKGDAVLNAGVDPGGNLILAGVYELDNGYYVFNYQFLQRRFILERGSTITFAGEPMRARANITATYVVNTSARDLLDNEVGSVDPLLANAFNQKVPFQVKLYITGVLNRPLIKFDIQLPDENTVMSSELRTTIENKLAQIRGDEAATNKQVFALLLLGRFVGEQSSDFFKGNGDDFSDLARHSVSQFLSDALNEIAGNLLKGVDVDLNLNTYRDYTGGGNTQRTDLNVALSKNFLDDRLTVSIGKNFGVQGQPDAAAKTNSNFLPDISLGYKLTKDGKYLLRAYRRNQFEVTLDGYVVETGISFVVTMDYDKFNELFKRRKK